MVHLEICAIQTTSSNSDLARTRISSDDNAFIKGMSCDRVVQAVGCETRSEANALGPRKVGSTGGIHEHGRDGGDASENTHD